MNFPPVNTVVFDLDGTMVDSGADVTLALNRMLAISGYAEVTKERVEGLLGSGSLALVSAVIDSLGEPVPDTPTLEGLTSVYLQEYASEPVRDSTLYPGVEQTLQGLASHGLRLGVCTNKNEQLATEVLRCLEIVDYFATIVGGDRLPVRKPNPAHLLAALDELGSTPEASALVGDSVYDSGCAIAAGARSVVVPWAPAEVEGHRLNHFTDLLDLVLHPTPVDRAETS